MVENINLLDNFAKRLADELDITAKDVVELISRHGFSGETFLQLSAGDIEPILDVIGSVANEHGLNPAWLAYGIEPKYPSG